MKGILKFFLIISVLYMICPADVLPDYIPILGWADDLGAAIIGAISFFGVYLLKSDER